MKKIKKIIEPGKEKGGRPNKISKFLDKAEEIITADTNAIIFTDEELFFTINDRLDEKDKISEVTFQNRKAKITKWKGNVDIKNTEANEELFKRFLLLIKRAQYIQKKYLLDMLKTDKNSRQRRAWLLERKFQWEYNLKATIKHEWDMNIGMVILPNKKISDAN